MKRQTKALVLLIILTFCTPAFAKHSHPYVSFTNEIVNSFTKKMEKQYDLICSGSGGQMPNDVEIINVMLTSGKPATIEEARRLEIIGVNSLLNEVNSHKKIKPYLREYPFKANRVEVSIFFINFESNSPYSDLAYTSLIKNRITYYSYDKKKQDLIEIYEESFEEAKQKYEASLIERK